MTETEQEIVERVKNKLRQRAIGFYSKLDLGFYEYERCKKYMIDMNGERLSCDSKSGHYGICGLDAR